MLLTNILVSVFAKSGNAMQINTAGRKREVIKALQDEVSLRLLGAVSETGKSAKDLTEELNMPSSSIYRSINELVKGGLLVVQSYRTLDDGGKYSVYRSACRRIVAKWEDGMLEVDIVPNEDVTAKFMRFWGSLGDR